MSLKKNVRGCVSLKKKKSLDKAVEVTVKARRKSFKTFVWILSKNSASGPSLVQHVLRVGLLEKAEL